MHFSPNSYLIYDSLFPQHHTRALTSLKLSQPASSLFFSTRNSKEPTRELPNSTRDSILEIFEDRESSLESSFATRE